MSRSYAVGRALQSVVVLSLVSGLAIAAPTVAQAKVHAPTALQVALKKYHSAKHQWVAQRHVIVATYKAAILAARASYQANLVHATTNAERKALRATLRTALAAARAKRAAALAALGPSPIKP